MFSLCQNNDDCYIMRSLGHIDGSCAHCVKSFGKVEYRIQFKILLFVYKSLTGLAPNYLSDLLSHYHTNRPLRSTNALLLSVPKTRLKLKGDQAFSVAAPATSLQVFKSSVKTYLFKKAYGLE